MVWFFIKKNFCDGWDNMLLLVLFNLILFALLAGAFFTVSALVEVSPAASFAAVPLFVCALNIPLLAFSNAALRLAGFKSVSVKEIFAEFGAVWKTALLFGVLIVLLIFTAAVALPFYFGMGNLLGIVLGAVIFWTLVIAVLSLQWFMPLHSYFGGPFRKNLKKCFILFFDNGAFSVFMFIYSCIVFAVSGILVFLAPGITGVILGYNNALRLRMYKYDWLEAHTDLPPKEARRSIPWDELLADDRETLGPLDLKGFIFPWK